MTNNLKNQQNTYDTNTNTHTPTNSQHMQTAATKPFAICMICLYLDSFSCCALTWRWLALLDYNSPQYQSSRCDTSTSKRLYSILLLSIVIDIYRQRQRQSERERENFQKVNIEWHIFKRSTVDESYGSRDFSKKQHSTKPHRAVLLMLFFGRKICTGLLIARRSYHCESPFVPVSHLKAFRIQWDIL